MATSEFSLYGIMSSANSDSITSSLLICIPFLSFFFLFILSLWLGLPILCWTEVVRVGILVLFLNLAGRLSAFHLWVLCWLWVCYKWLSLCWNMLPLYPLWWEILLWMDVDFVKCFFCVCWDNPVFFVYPFVDVEYHTDWFAYAKPSLQPWNEFNWIMAYDPYVMLDSVC